MYLLYNQNRSRYNFDLINANCTHTSLQPILRPEQLAREQDMTSQRGSTVTLDSEAEYLSAASSPVLASRRFNGDMGKYLRPLVYVFVLTAFSLGLCTIQQLM